MRDARLGQASAAQFHDARLGVFRDATRTPLRPRRLVLQARLTVNQEPARLLTNRRHAHAMPKGRGGERYAVFKNVVNHFESTGERESAFL
jgi:hypothetical protein